MRMLSVGARNANLQFGGVADKNPRFAFRVPAHEVSHRLLGLRRPPGDGPMHESPPAFDNDHITRPA